MGIFCLLGLHSVQNLGWCGIQKQKQAQCAGPLAILVSQPALLFLTRKSQTTTRPPDSLLQVLALWALGLFFTSVSSLAGYSLLALSYASRNQIGILRLCEGDRQWPGQ